MVKVSTACFKIKSSILWQQVLFINFLEKIAIISLKKKLTVLPLQYRRCVFCEDLKFNVLLRQTAGFSWSNQQYSHINLLKPTDYVMHQQFNIQQLYALPTLYLCVLYLSENKQRLVPLTP